MLNFENPDTVLQFDESSAAVADYFDRRYGSNPDYWWNRPGEAETRLSPDHMAHELSLVTSTVLRIIQNENPLRDHPYVLDIGGGGGIDTIRYALMGYQVDVNDVSPRSAELITMLAAKYGVADQVRVVCGPAQELELEPRHYGLALCNGVLDYVQSRDAKLKIVHNIQDATAHNGLDALSTWIDFPNPSVPCHSEVAMSPDPLGEVTIGEYLDVPGWSDRLAYLELNKADNSHPECKEQPHRHSHAKGVMEYKQDASSLLLKPNHSRRLVWLEAARNQAGYEVVA